MVKKNIPDYQIFGAVEMLNGPKAMPCISSGHYALNILDAPALAE